MNAPSTRERPNPPSALRVVWLVVAVGLRRFWNTAVAGRMTRKNKGETQRTGTPTKSRGTAVILAFALFGIGMQSCRMAATTVIQATRASAAHRAIDAGSYHCLVEAAEHASARDDGGVSLDGETHMLTRACLQQRLAERGRPRGMRLDDAADTILDAFETHGLSWFRIGEQRAVLPFPNASLWPEKQDSSSLLDALSWLALASAGLLLLFGLSIEREDLGKADGMLESLYQLPASTAALHLALMIRRATVSFMLWGFVLPFWLGVAICAGFGWGSPFVALGVCVHLGLIVGALQIVIETWARLHVRPSVVRNVQAIGAVVAMLPYAGFSIAATKGAVAGAWFDRVHVAAVARWAPVLSIGRIFEPESIAPAIGVATLWTIVIVGCALLIVDRLLTHGLVASSGNLTGTRVRSTPRMWTRSWMRGVATKDILLLLRDRNLLAQAVVTPVLIVTMQVAGGRGLFANTPTSLAGACSAAMFFAGYAYAFGPAGVLAFEGPALWMLFSFPRPVHRVLLEKVSIWIVVGFLFALGSLLILGRSAHFVPLDAARILTLIAGVVVFAFVASGLGVLATDPLSPTPTRKQRPSAMMLYLALLGGFVRVLYGDGLWDKLVALVLAIVLALALWQKVRDVLPYLLDPTEAPPPSIAISDAIVAVVAYFFLQAVLTVVGSFSDAPLDVTLTIASAAAAAIVAIVSLLTFRAAKVANLAAIVGARREAGVRRSRIPWPIAAIVLGLTAAGFAAGYQALGDRFAPLRTLFEESRATSIGATFDKRWFALFAIVIAPLAEELLFRGFLLRAMRRSGTRAAAIVGSAALFAICHPPVSVAPVFVLGCAAGFALESTGLLWAAMLTHATYNGAIVALAW